jgi:hypothetical protein
LPHVLGNGVTDDLKNGRRMELAQRMAERSNAKTTGSTSGTAMRGLDEVERIGISAGRAGTSRSLSPSSFRWLHEPWVQFKYKLHRGRKRLDVVPKKSITCPV